MQTPFIDRMETLAQLNTRFFVPGHKGGRHTRLPFSALMAYDLTEIDGADNLRNPSGPLLQSEENMAKAFGSGATLYTVAGASSAVQAMLTLFVKNGDNVIMARNCHASAVTALAFIDADPLWLAAEDAAALPFLIENALKNKPGTPVFLTSPDYYGAMQDVAKISAVCRRYNAPLLVDNSHGSHLKFIQPDRHPLTLGADAVADSAHKTLFALTPSALLHLKDGTLKSAARAALNLYSSTSPAYPALMSLDYVAGCLLNGEPDYNDAARRVAQLAQQTAAIAGRCDDPLRLAVVPSKAGLKMEMVKNRLKEVGILPEYDDGEQLIFMMSPFNKPQEYEKLAATLSTFEAGATQPLEKRQTALPAVATSVRRALFGTKETVATKVAVGRVAASIEAPCPPGTPLVMPGEIIDESTARRLAAGGILQLDVLK